MPQILLAFLLSFFGLGPWAHVVVEDTSESYQASIDDEWIYQLPISRCMDWNNWAWYPYGSSDRIAKCDTHPNAAGHVSQIETYDMDGYIFIRLDRYDSVACLESHTGVNYYHDTRLASARCLDHVLRRQNVYEMADIRRIHGPRFKIMDNGFSLEPNVTRSGTTVAQFADVLFDDCIIECADREACRAMTHVPNTAGANYGICYLHAAGTSPVPWDGYWSAAKMY